jgi:peptide chain release factor 1
MQYAKKLEAMEARFEDLTRQMTDPAIIADSDLYRKTTKSRSEFEEVVTRYREWKRDSQDLEGARLMLEESDPELREMARAEVERLEPAIQKLEEDLRVLLLPKDPNDERNVVIEIRAGAGGDEASLFAAEMFRMYSRYAEEKKWRVELTSTTESSAGGVKEVIALISGQRVYSRMKYEGGVHRVQRVPVTEAQGRIHTSTITVAVMPEADEVEIKIDAKDIRIDTTRRCASRTFQPERWFPARTKSRRSRIARRPSACCARVSTRWNWTSNAPRSAASGAAWWERATAAKRSALTTSKRTASPTTASGSRSTSSTR